MGFIVAFWGKVASRGNGEAFSAYRFTGSVRKKDTTYHIPEDVATAVAAERSMPYGLRTYASLFSSAGIGCYGFKEAGFALLAPHHAF